MTRSALVFLAWIGLAAYAIAGVGDPQIRTDHPYYPGELACSTFERLFATQAELYRRIVGRDPQTDQDIALAAWLWRNTHYAHGEEGAADLWGKGFSHGGDLRSREYWTGLFAHGFGLCGTTHSQWIAEFEARLGHNRSRGVGAAGHNSFEVLLKGGLYGDGKWVLLDHDLSTVVFDDRGDALLSLKEVQQNWQRLTDRAYRPEKQNGWLVCGLHPSDGSSFSRYEVAEYLAGYSGPPPMVHLRRGETLRRYFEPGLEDGKTFVFWGRNYRTGDIPGPERSLTWVNQPGKMRDSRDGAGYKPGQMRFANAVYTYEPDFSGPYREGVVDEADRHVTFEFYTPYVIGATPPNDKPWGIYDSGCRNGLVLSGNANCGVAVSVDQGETWQGGGMLRGGLDLTDCVKGRQQYFLRFSVGAKHLADSGLKITTVCQANPSVLPRLKDGGTRVEFAASNQAVVSAGPNLAQAQPHLVAGAFGTPNVTLELKTPRGEQAMTIYAAAHVQSGNPPNPDVKYSIDYSTDGGTTWEPVVGDWTIPRRGDEPGDFWSQSLCWGAAPLQGRPAAAVQVRFRNSGRRNFARCEAHLAYQVPAADATRVTYAWSDSRGTHSASHVFAVNRGQLRNADAWNVPTASGVRTRWVEFSTAQSP
jgi:hypothetical protein